MSFCQKVWIPIYPLLYIANRSNGFKTAIAYIQALMEERTNLTQRLTYARSALSHSSLNNHSQILQVSPANLDDKGVPLWEREWSGGTGWAEISGCDADDAEGEGDEEDGE